MRLADIIKKPGSSYNDVEAFDVASMEAVRIIDVREPDEFVGTLGHIPGAELVPLQTLQQEMKAWSKNQALLVVCRSGGRSAMAAGVLADAGFDSVSNLRGGMIAYNQAGLTIER